MAPQLKRKIGNADNAESSTSQQKKARTLTGDDTEDSYDESDSDHEGESRSTPRVPNMSDIQFTDEHISTAGTIMRIELINFMCHTHLKVDFGPKINFVIGHNGSGKSAILTALTVALGANANTTQRGKSLSGLIKEGTSAANVSIKISNGGDGAYKPSVYPEAIIIERRINKEGPHPYKIKNISGKIVSTKREELVAILDHLGILINNPITLLTQEMAKKFLSDSSAEDKYKLFMQGTQLSQLQADYDNVRESLETSRAIIARKKTILPILREKANEAQRRYSDLQELQEIDSKIDMLNNELVWSQIISKEREAEKLAEEVEMVEQKLTEIKNSYDAQKLKCESIDAEIAAVKAELAEFRSGAEVFATEKDALESESKTKKAKLESYLADIRSINRNIKETKLAKEKHLKELEEQKQKMESNSRLKRDVIMNEISILEQEKESKVAELRKIDAEQSEYESQKSRLMDKKEGMNRDLIEKRHKKNEIENGLRNLEAQRGNSMKAFGHRMPEVVSEIKRETRWKMRRPVGPFGSTLRLKYPQYADTLECVLGKTLNAFVVECFEDKDLLSQIFKKCNMTHIPIMVSKYDLFDYSSGEPDSHLLTILHALEFKDEWVKRQMIVANKIEQILLMEDRVEADRLMMSKPRNVILCFTSKGHKVGSRTGMKTEALEEYTGQSRFSEDIDAQMKKRKKEHEDVKTMMMDLDRSIKEVSAQIDRVNKAQFECKGREARLSREMTVIETKITDKRDTLQEDEAVDLAGYEEDIRLCDEKIKRHIQQFGGIKEQYRLLKIEVHGLDEKIKVLNEKMEERAKIRDEFRLRIEKYQKKKDEMDRVLINIRSQQQTYRNRYESRKTDYANLKRLISQWIQECQEDYPDRVNTERSPDAVEREKRRLEAMAEEKNKDLGASLEEIRDQTTAVVREWNDAKETIETMEKLSRTLQKMLTARIEKWEAFKIYISLAAKNYFRYYLQKRGDYGTLKFDFKESKLELRVSTGDQYRKGTRQKNSRSLSGGEKSFSQISLLLSIWQNISTPIICLDEFDVFMDDVNRKQTMGMIMDAANDNASQYIFITPLGAADMVPGPYVTIHRLADPER